jgi:subtilase-type serine protease
MPRQRRRFSGALAIAVVLLAGCGGSFGATPMPSPTVAFAPLALPTPQFSPGITLPTGIFANLITATDVETSGATVGALSNSGAWTAIVYPSAGSTAAYGPAATTSGYRVVGSYKRPGAPYPFDNAFSYDSESNTFATIDPPPSFCAPSLCNEAIAHSSYGMTLFEVVGNCDAVSAAPTPLAYSVTANAFLYTPATNTYALINMPKSLSTTAYGIWIDSDTVVAGGFTDLGGTHGYVRGLVSGTILTYDYPGAGITHFEGITGAGGNGNYNLAGNYSSATPGATVYGFFLPVRNWQFGAPIVLGAVSANSVYQNTVIGVMPAGTASTGYIATVP